MIDLPMRRVTVSAPARLHLGFLVCMEDSGELWQPGRHQRTVDRHPYRARCGAASRGTRSRTRREVRPPPARPIWRRTRRTHQHRTIHSCSRSRLRDELALAIGTARPGFTNGILKREPLQHCRSGRRSGIGIGASIRAASWWTRQDRIRRSTAYRYSRRVPQPVACAAYFRSAYARPAR